MDNKRFALLAAIKGWQPRQGYVVDVNYAAASMLPEVSYIKAGDIFERFLILLNADVNRLNFDIGPYISLAAKLILHSPEERTRASTIRYLRKVQIATEGSPERLKVDQKLRKLHHTWRHRARKGGVEAECTENDLQSAIWKVAPQPPKRQNSRTLVHAPKGMA